MNTDDADNGASPTSPLFGLLASTTKLLPPSSLSPEAADPLIAIIALICIFLLLAAFLIFVTLCKPVVPGRSRFGPRKCMPQHVADASEPQLRLWKRLGSLRCSIRTFRRSRPVSQHQLAQTTSSPVSHDRVIIESTKM